MPLLYGLTTEKQIMFNIDVRIERIQNGYIVTENDSTRCRRYFPSLVSFVESGMVEAAKKEDKYFNEHYADGAQFNMRAVSSEYIKSDIAV